MKTMKKGTVIGSRNFILQQSLEYSGRTVAFTEIAMIEFNDFLKLLQEYQDDYEHYAMLRDNLKYNPSYKGQK